MLPRSARNAMSFDIILNSLCLFENRYYNNYSDSLSCCFRNNIIPEDYSTTCSKGTAVKIKSSNQLSKFSFPFPLSCKTGRQGVVVYEDVVDMVQREYCKLNI
jgi:hypothetical protein